jgi:hypothetical protein
VKIKKTLAKKQVLAVNELGIGKWRKECRMEAECENRAAGVVGVDTDVSKNKQKDLSLSAASRCLTFVSLAMGPYYGVSW